MYIQISQGGKSGTAGTPQYASRGFDDGECQRFGSPPSSHSMKTPISL